MSTATLDPRRAPTRRPLLRGMPWVTWRQHRTALLVVTGFFGAAGILLVVQGLAMHAAYRSLGLTTCGALRGDSCRSMLDVFTRRYGAWPDRVGMVLLFAPAALGVFVGGPLVAREWDAGTYRFAWTLGRTRTRWLVTKLALLGGALTGLTVALSILYAWWYQPWVPLRGHIEAPAYDIAGPVFTACALFCFIVSVLLGAIIRRTVPTLATATLVTLIAKLAPAIWLRPHIQPPVVANVEAHPDTGTGMQLDWWVTDSAGHRLSAAQTDRLDVQAGPETVDGHITFHRWLVEHHYATWISFQPDNRFWHFQIVETAGYLIAAALAAAITIWWIRRPLR